MLGIQPSGKIIKEINCAFIYLIPKTIDPWNLSNYRPIYLCNVIYKILVNPTCNMIKKYLNNLFSTNQNAFIPGRLII